VLIGGGRIGQSGSTERTELSTAYRWTFSAIDWAGMIAGLGGKKAVSELALPVAGMAVHAYQDAGLPGGAQVGTYGGALIAGAQLATGHAPSKWAAEDWASNSATVVGSGIGVEQQATSSGPPRTY
jgi:hypothetical protein